MSDSSRKRAHASDETPRKKVCFSVNEGSFPNSQPVRILVGEAEETFYVHETLLRPNAPFFHKALKEPWKERGERTVRLTETDPDIFRIYMQWLYTGRLFCTKEDGKLIDQAGIQSKHVQNNKLVFSRWSNCYKLADILQNSDFKDALIDMLLESTVEENCYSSSLSRVIYDHSSKDSVHRKMVVDTLIHVSARDLWRELLSGFSNTDNLSDVLEHISSKLMEGIHEYATEEFFDMNDTCRYHEHTQHGKPCYKTTTGYRF